MNWVAFFSQTGSEIAHVSERVGRWPNLIVTNRQDGFEKINQKLFSGKSRILFTEKKPDVQRYKEAIRSDSIVTLHGWLRIVPEEICGKYEIYNGHPGLITKYPELKGKDPQERAYNDKYKTAGSVIHRVVPEVDAGEILAEEEVDIKDKSLNEVYESLHEISSDLWVEFLKEKFKDE
jgi:folate-dependent phosphoribosylglycinamide formyltransferase PurN|tara:strand:+ start:2870 stop:3403 length:534 start_codon:yes stop_codon:yes gene_type:complete